MRPLKAVGGKAASSKHRGHPADKHIEEPGPHSHVRLLWNLRESHGVSFLGGGVQYSPRVTFHATVPNKLYKDQYEPIEMDSAGRTELCPFVSP